MELTPKLARSPLQEEVFAIFIQVILAQGCTYIYFRYGISLA
jgi:hypothetical protein